MIECACPTEHTITKLGHCRTCPYHDAGETVVAETAFTQVFLCGKDHGDGTPHDFSWAMYADDRATYGVCRCGLEQMAIAHWRAA